MSFLSRETGYQPGDLVGDRYRIVKPLGQGSSGITYRAEDLEMKAEVALKVLSLQRMDDWKRFELFEREAKVLAQLDHPSIPKYIDYFKLATPNGGLFCLAQELADGLPLSELVARGWRADEAKAKQLAENVLNVLTYLHGLTPPVIHRDIKPQNIIGRKDGRISLVDFGAVQDVYRDTMLGGSTVVGTFGYMAPEQFRGRAVPATDLYGLGATLAFLMTQQSPADLPEKDLKIDVQACVKASPQFLTWLEGLLEPSCDRRFKSASEALNILRGETVRASLSNTNSQEGFRSTIQNVNIAGKISPRLLIHIPANRLNGSVMVKIFLNSIAMIFVISFVPKSIWIIFKFTAAFPLAIVGLFIAMGFFWTIASIALNIFSVFKASAAVSIDITRGRMLIAREGFWGKYELPKIKPDEIHLIDINNKRGVTVFTPSTRFYFGTYLSGVDRARVAELIATFINDVNPKASKSNKIDTV